MPSHKTERPRNSLGLVPELRVVQGGLTPERAYRNVVHRDFRRAVESAAKLRPRGVGRRPTKYLYQITGGYSDPMGPIMRAVEDLCRLRDGVPAEKVALYDEYLRGVIGEGVNDVIHDAITASNARRAQRGNGGAA